MLFQTVGFVHFPDYNVYVQCGLKALSLEQARQASDFLWDLRLRFELSASQKLACLWLLEPGPSNMECVEVWVLWLVENILGISAFLRDHEERLREASRTY